MLKFLVKYLYGTEEIFENVIAKINNPDSYIFHFADGEVMMKDCCVVREISLYVEED